MADSLPRSVSRPLQFKNGSAIGISNRWHKGQYCTILTEAGLVGCGIYDVKTAAHFGQAVAIARGTALRRDLSLASLDDRLKAAAAAVGLAEYRP